MDAEQLERNREAQAALYGEPLGDLLRRLIEAFSLNQTQLAASIGVSAPMLSQLMSAQRVKIGNPAVVQRLQGLSALADDVQADRVDQAEVERRLQTTHEVSGVLTRTTHHGGEAPAAGEASAADVVAALRGLFRAVASGQELQEVAAELRTGHPGLSELIRTYGVGRPAEALEHFARHEHLF